MRRALASTMTACLLGTFLVFDVVASPGAAPGPVAPVRLVLPLTAASAAASSATLTPFTPATEGLVPALQSDRVLTRPFSVLGVTWDAGSASATDVLVEVRVREDGTWSTWTRLAANDAAPDAGTEEARLAAGIASTEPLVTASADGVQVRVATGDGEVPADLEAVVIDPGTSATDGTADSTALVPAGAATTPTIVSRAAWGADESLRRCAPGYSSTVLAATVHHTAGSNTYTAAQSAGIVRGIYAYHTGSLGWCDIGYNFLVDKFGTVYEGRHGGITQAVRGAHAGGFNDRTVGVSAMGNYETASAPTAMVAAIGHVVGWKLSLFGRSATGTATLTSAGGSSSRHAAGTVVTVPTVFGHRDVGRTACPGAHLYAQMPAVRAAAAVQTAAAPTPTATTPTSTTPTTTPTSTTPTSTTPPTTTQAPTSSPTTTTQAPTSSPTTTTQAPTSSPTTPTATPTPTRTTTATATATADPTVDLRNSSLVPVEVDRTSRSELLAYTSTTGRRTLLDLSTTGRTRELAHTGWTSGWHSVVPIEHDGTAGSEVLLYNRTSGRVVVVDTTTGGATPMLLDRRWATGWTHVVAVEVDGTSGSELLLYNRRTGARSVVEVRADASTRTFHSGTWSTGLTAVTAVEVDRTARSEVSLYAGGSGRHTIEDLTTAGSRTLATHQWRTGLDTVTALESDRTAGQELLTYDVQTGAGTLRDVTTSTGALRDVRTYAWTSGWTRITGLEVDGTSGSELFVHNRTTGRLLLLDLTSSGVASQL